MADPSLYFDEYGGLRLSFGIGCENYRQPNCPECEKPIRWNLDMMSFTPPPFQKLAHAHCTWTPEGFDTEKERALDVEREMFPQEVVEHIGPTEVEDGPGAPSEAQSDGDMADSMVRTTEEAQRAVDVYKLVRKFDEDAILPEEVRVFHQDDWDSWAELAGCESPSRHVQLLALHVLWELDGAGDPDEDDWEALAEYDPDEDDWSDDDDWDSALDPGGNMIHLVGEDVGLLTRHPRLVPFIREALLDSGLTPIEVDSAIRKAEAEAKRVRDKQRTIDGVHRYLLKNGLAPLRLSEALSVADRILDGVHARALDSIQGDVRA